MRYTLLAHRVPGHGLVCTGLHAAWVLSQPACLIPLPADRRTCVGTVHVPPERRRALAGALLLAMLALGVVAAPGAWPRWPAGLCAWAALSLLLPELPPSPAWPVHGTGRHRHGRWGACHAARPRHQRQRGCGSQLGYPGAARRHLVPYHDRAPAGAAHVPPRGPRAFATTLLGVHLFSVVINLPAMLIAGERMQRGGRLHRLQNCCCRGPSHRPRSGRPSSLPWRWRLAMRPDRRCTCWSCTGCPPPWPRS